VVVAGLLVPGAKVEIEGMALLAGKGKWNSKKSKK